MCFSSVTFLRTEILFCSPDFTQLLDWRNIYVHFGRSFSVILTVTFRITLSPYVNRLFLFWSSAGTIDLWKKHLLVSCTSFLSTFKFSEAMYFKTLFLSCFSHLFPSSQCTLWHSATRYHLYHYSCIPPKSQILVLPFFSFSIFISC